MRMKSKYTADIFQAESDTRCNTEAGHIFFMKLYSAEYGVDSDAVSI